MTKTFSRTPWINLDKIDDNGIRAEVQVTTGVGTVDVLELSPKGGAYKVHFETDNNPNGVGGYFPKDDPLVEVLKEYKESGEPIEFRMEKRRQNHVDRSLPMIEISPPWDMKAARDNTFKGIVAVKGLDSEEWVRSPNQRTRAEEDPQDSTDPGNAYAVSLDEFTGGVTTQQPTVPPVIMGRSFEAPPYADYNNNGSLNPGSYAVAVPVTLFSFIEDYCRENKLEIEDSQKVALTRTLLKVANRLQIDVYDGQISAPMLGAGSHTRARAIAFQLINNSSPITVEIASDKEAQRKWAAGIVNRGGKIWKWAISQAEQYM